MFLNISGKKFPFLLKLTIGLSASVILLLTSVIYSYRVSTCLYQNSSLIERSDSLIAKLDLLDLKLEDCESQVRAYAMSKRIPFLYDYEKSRKETWDYLASLEKLAEGNPGQSEKTCQLHELLKKRFRLLEEAIAIEKGEITDKKGLKKRLFLASQLRTDIKTTAQDLKAMLGNSLQQRKQESHELLLSNQTANQVAIALSLIIAIFLGLVVVNDLRQRVKTESELRALNNQKSQFFSIISHDLRGPTRNTTLLLEMMDDPMYSSTPEDSKNMARLALESARQTQKLVEDLLTWGRLQMDQVEVVSVRFRPFESAEKVCASLRSTALLKQIILENNIPRNLLVQADVNMVETVIRNLVSNAIKFTPSAGKIKIVAQQFGKFVELVVEDSGVGMSAEAIEKIFSFHTKHTTKGTAGEPGTGLGLAFCREFVERNGGSIAVESQIGRGSKFNVRLPAAELVNQ